MTKHKKNTRSRQKRLCRVRNWSAYDQALVNRGSLTIWISEEAIAHWKADKPRQRGAAQTYSDMAIETALTTLSRRGKVLAVRLPRQRKSGSLHLVVDSSGLKIYEEGGWKMCKHGKSKRRTWRKLHLGIDAESGEIQAGCLSTVSLSGSQAAPTPFIGRNSRVPHQNHL